MPRTRKKELLAFTDGKNQPAETKKSWVSGLHGAVRFEKSAAAAEGCYQIVLRCPLPSGAARSSRRALSSPSEALQRLRTVLADETLPGQLEVIDGLPTGPIRQLAAPRVIIDGVDYEFALRAVPSTTTRPRLGEGRTVAYHADAIVAGTEGPENGRTAAREIRTSYAGLPASEKEFYRDLARVRANRIAHGHRVRLQGRR